MITQLRLSHRKGVTLVETLLTLVVLMIVSGLSAILWAQQRDVQTARSIAYRQAELLNAAQNYIATNATALVAATAGGAVAIPAGQTTVGGAQPVGTGGLTSMQTQGFLNGQFIDANSYGQNSWLVVKAGASPNSLEGIVFTTGGQNIPDSVLGTAMQFLGADGGYIPNAPHAGQAAKIVGSKGGWIANTADFTTALATPNAGHLAGWIASTPNTGITGDFLWRTDIGVAEANRMHTNIDVGQHELNHVSQITGGPAALNQDPGSSTQTAINIANTIVPGTTPLADASLNAAPTEYQDGAGATYPYYSRVDGSNRFRRLDPSTLIDSSSWDPQGGLSPRVYPAGMRLIDALPSIVIQSSYVAKDNTIVPKPICGNPANQAPYDFAPHLYERIFATPLSSFDYVAPSATTTSTINYTNVPVISTASLMQIPPNTITLNTTTDNVNNVQSVTSTTVVDASGLSTKIYATDNGNSWLFRASRSSGSYITDPSDPRFQQALSPEVPFGTYATNYQSDYLIQTACYYGN